MRTQLQNFLMAALLVSSGIAHAGSDDVILQSRTDSDSLNGLISKTEVILANSNVMSAGINSSTTLDQDPTFKLSDLDGSPSLTKFLNSVKELTHVDLNDAILRVKIPKIAYEIDSIGVNAKDLQVNDPTLSVDAGVSLSGINIGLSNGIQLDIMIPSGSGYDTFLTATVDPVSVLISKNLPPATLDVTFQATRDQALHFSLTHYNLDALPVYIHTHEKDVLIQAESTHAAVTADQIHVQPKTFHVGPFSPTLTFDEFKPLIQEELNPILQKVILSIGDSLKTSIGPSILQSISNFDAKNNFAVATSSFYVQYQTTSFSQPRSDQIAFALSGTSCSPALYASFKDACVDHLPPYTPARVISDDDHANSKVEVANKLESKDANAALTLSEEYLNRLLKTTVDAGLFTDVLAKNDLSLGEKGVFVVLDSTSPDLILDLEYSGTGKGLETLLVNKKNPFRFPLRMSLTPGFEIKDGVPNLVLKISKVNSNSDEIENGISQYDLQSKMPFLLKSEIAKVILKLADGLQGTSITLTDLPMLKGTGMESSWFETSPHGRLNLYMK